MHLDVLQPVTIQLVSLHWGVAIPEEHKERLGLVSLKPPLVIVLHSVLADPLALGFRRAWD